MAFEAQTAPPARSIAATCSPKASASEKSRTGDCCCTRTSGVAVVDGIMRLSELKASDAMTPRVDLIGIDLDDHISTVLEAMKNGAEKLGL